MSAPRPVGGPGPRPAGLERQAPSRAPVAAAAVATAALVLAGAAYVALRPAPASDALSADELARAEADMARLLADGLPQAVTVRDWAAVDGDAVLANGVRIVAGATPVAVALAPGTVTLQPVAGELGCITLEIVATGRAPYRVCLPPGTPVSLPVR